MPKVKSKALPLAGWLTKNWVQWLIAAVVFFLISWLFMGRAITDCTTASTALGSDSTGGFGWVQWAGGNDLTWGHTDKSNYPFGETLGKPQFVSATIFIGIFKVLSVLSSPICGINLMILLGYMSSALVMFGFIKWLLRRFDIAMFAGFAAAFMPFHQLKSQSHVNYLFSSVFILLIWTYVWFMSKPSYRRAVVLGLVSSIGFYFDGYFVLISAIVLGALLLSAITIGLYKVYHAWHTQPKSKYLAPFIHLVKQLIVALAVLGTILVPILLVYVTSSDSIKQTMTAVRSDIRIESTTYGARPIEFITPSNNSALLPDQPPLLRVIPHGSNPSENTLYIGWTLIVLTGVALAYLFYTKYRKERFRGLSYGHLMITLIILFLVSFGFSLPAYARLFGHEIPTPSDILISLTANWRVLSRLFLAMQPAIVIMVCLGLYLLIKRFSSKFQIAIVLFCSLVLFAEYLPSPLPLGSSDLHKDEPKVYQQLEQDRSVNLVAEYPITSFQYTPEIFTFQIVHNKTLLNANDGKISVGPFHSSIAGLNDPQTIGVLKGLGVDLLILHDMRSDNDNLIERYSEPAPSNSDSINRNAGRYSYKIKDSVVPRHSVLTVKQGYASLSVDQEQISHRFVTQQATLGVLQLKKQTAKSFRTSLSINSACPTSAEVVLSQAGRTLWQGKVGSEPTPVELTVTPADFTISTSYCSIDLTKLSAEPIITQ